MNLPNYLKVSKSLYVCITNLQGQYIYVNDFFNDRYSYMFEDFLGVNAWATVYEEDHSILQSAVEECLNNHGSIASCYLRKPSSKSKNITHQTFWEFSAYFNEQNELAGVFCIGQEITLSEKQIGLLYQLPDSFLIINSERKILECNFRLNHPLSNLTDLKAKSDFLEIYPESVRNEILNLFEETGLQGLENSFEYSILSNEGKEKYFNLRLSVISYNSNPQILILERDVTAENKNSILLKDTVERIRNIWECMTDLFHVINKEGQIEYANSSWEEFFGIKGKDYIGRNVWELFPEAVDTPFYIAYNEAISNQKAVHIVEYYAPRDEWYDLNIYPYEGGITIYTRDITATKKLELKEKELKAQLNSVWEKFIDGYVKLNKDLVFTYTNRAWNELFGFEVHEVEGKSFLEVFPEMEGEEIITAIRDVERSKELKKQLSFFKNQELWINSAILPDGDGFNIYMQDASPQEKMKSAMNDLSFMTSHELRHEYAKLHSVINLLTVTKEDDQYLLKEANKSLIQINSLISVMNDKLTFNRDNSIRGSSKHYSEFEEVVLIDDDHVINFINARVLRLLFKDARVKSFVQAEKALEYLKETDTLGNKLIFIDLNMPGFDGWDFLEAYSQFSVRSPIYVLTSSINPKDIERSLGYKEVVKFLTKPLSEELLEAERIRPVGVKQNY